VSSLLIIIIVIAVLAFAAGFIFVRAYNKRLDRIASGQERDTHSSVPEPRTTVSAVYRIILMVVAAAVLLTVSALSGKLSSLQTPVSLLRSDQNSMNRELRELRQQLEERDRLVLSSGWELLEPDLQRRTALVSCTVTLRQYSAETAAALSLNGRTVPLAPGEGGSFAAEFPVDLFEEYAQPRLLVTEEGKTVTEDVDFPQYVFWDLLPMPMFECRFRSDVNLGKLKYEGSYKIGTTRPEDEASVTVTCLTGGKELKNLDLTDQTRSGQWIELEKGLELDRDLTFRVEIVTRSGFRIVEQNVMIYDASADLGDMEFTRILDQEGNLLWEDVWKK
jgi:flagellar basal body-associated protein FliL